MQTKSKSTKTSRSLVAMMQLDRPPSQCISYAQITCQDAEDDHRLDLDDAIYDGGANDVDVLLSDSNHSALDSPQLTYRLLKVTVISKQKCRREKNDDVANVGDGDCG